MLTTCIKEGKGTVRDLEAHTRCLGSMHGEHDRQTQSGPRLGGSGAADSALKVCGLSAKRTLRRWRYRRFVQLTSARARAWARIIRRLYYKTLKRTAVVEQERDGAKWVCDRMGAELRALVGRIVRQAENLQLSQLQALQTNE